MVQAAPELIVKALGKCRIESCRLERRSRGKKCDAQRFGLTLRVRHSLPERLQRLNQETVDRENREPPAAFDGWSSLVVRDQEISCFREATADAAFEDVNGTRPPLDRVEI